jgi:hypothetical protein
MNNFTRDRRRRGAFITVVINPETKGSPHFTLFI